MTIDRMICVLKDEHELRKVTHYVLPELVIKVSRNGKRDRRSRQETFVVTIGRPNYTEKQWIKKYIAAGESFPIKRLQLKWYTK